MTFLRDVCKHRHLILIILHSVLWDMVCAFSSRLAVQYKDFCSVWIVYVIIKSLFLYGECEWDFLLLCSKLIVIFELIYTYIVKLQNYNILLYSKIFFVWMNFSASRLLKKWLALPHLELIWESHCFTLKSCLCWNLDYI